MSKVIRLQTKGEVKTNDGREFTRLLGGFGEDKPMFLIWQAGELLGQETNLITKNFENNVENFEEGVDYIDLKSLPNDFRKTETVDITGFLKSVGITHHKYGRTKEWLAFSFSGMMKLVKIATTKESWEIYDRFLEDYFQTKAENQVMKKTIQEEIEELIKQRAFLVGMAAIDKDEGNRIKMQVEAENVNRRITKLEKSLTKEETVKQLQPKIHIADTILDTESNYDIGSFAKILGIKDMGRNNMFKWMREQGLLMKGNEPYQKYMKYFKVIPVVNARGYTNNKTLLKPNGVEYVVKRLIDDDKAVTKSVDEILEELEGIAV